ncbi:hypothetical protein CEE37_04065 [candidate division LCP-89 bacterium B3_LCP]|uniref:carboxypeptidase T n=1 Tax=candidate division LCP-89 bacterium B3_LCP TaxID=2012998 RepID=A0A532V3Q1_UNCL8|nr:MAG: hypothetical protein CEE37_04065 [candidate division LCP-89 bacterium B3_LCP]
MTQLRAVIIIISIALLTFLSASSAFGKYHQVLIPDGSPQTIMTLGELGLPLDDAEFLKDVGISIPLNDAEIILLENRGISYRILQEDLEKYYEDICIKNLKIGVPPTDEDPVHMKYGSMGGFYTFQEIVADLDSMHLLYPDICTAKEIIGYGWDNNPIYMVKISDNAASYEGEPEGIFDALHHAREPGAYTALLYAMWYLLENYGTDPEATYLVDNRELYFVPVVNPDGLLYNQMTNPNGGGMWRKNRRNNGSSYGVDLNRNYTYQWGYDNQGSSPTPSSSTYRGPSAGSEPETQAMMNFIGEHNFATGMTIHTSAGKYLCAYGYANVPPEHYDVHMDYMAYASAQNGYSYGYCYQIMYASNGRTQDWQLHEHDIINVEPEVGGNGFWPPVNYIMPEARENLNCHLNQFWCAGGQVVFSSLEVVDGHLIPGESEELVVTVFNRGWGTSEALDFELTTSDPYVTLQTATSSAEPLVRRTTASNSATPFQADISPNCPIGHEAEFTVTIDQNGFIRAETISLIVGTPVVFFADDAESGLGNWTYSGGWGLDGDNPHGGNYSFSDSPGRDYYNNTTAVFTLAQPINLTNATQVWLDFWGRWDIESNWDFCQLEVSTNGSNWFPVSGLHTVPGNGQGVQPYGEPGWEGVQANWVNEFVDLDAFAGQPYLKFRFEFKSDGGVTGDGFFADDIQLLGFIDAGTPPDVAITLTPYGAPIQIPSSGGSFDFNIALTNNEPTSQNLDAWIMVTLPNGSPYGPVLGPVNLTLAGSSTLDRDRTQDVPGGAPSGIYSYTAYLGLYPTITWVEDSFDFEKLSSGDGSYIEEWMNSGESFDLTSEASVPDMPEDFGLLGAHPNPFNPSTVLSFQLQSASLVNLSVYDISGRLVMELIDGWRDVGVHEVTFDGFNLPSGMYFAKLQAENLKQTQKLLLLK